MPCKYNQITLFLFIACFFTFQSTADQKPSATTQKLLERLDMKGSTYDDLKKQQPVPVQTDTVKGQKVLDLKGVASLDAQRKKPVKLKEGMLDMWVYIPQATGEKIKATSSKSNIFYAGIVNAKDKTAKELYVPLCLSLAICYIPDLKTFGVTSFCKFTASKESLHPPVPLQGGWHRVALCFKDNYAIAYVDGVAVHSTEAMAENQGDKAQYLPAAFDELSISNGIKGRNGSDIHDIAIAQVVLADQYLTCPQMQQYHASGKLPKSVNIKWEIDFDKGKPKAKSTRFKKSGEVKTTKIN